MRHVDYGCEKVNNENDIRIKVILQKIVSWVYVSLFLEASTSNET
jgi:hypothetical protein